MHTAGGRAALRDGSAATRVRLRRTPSCPDVDKVRLITGRQLRLYHSILSGQPGTLGQLAPHRTTVRGFRERGHLKNGADGPGSAAPCVGSDGDRCNCMFDLLSGQKGACMTCQLIESHSNLILLIGGNLSLQSLPGHGTSAKD